MIVGFRGFYNIQSVLCFFNTKYLSCKFYPVLTCTVTECSCFRNVSALIYSVFKSHGVLVSDLTVTVRSSTSR